MTKRTPDLSNLHATRVVSDSDLSPEARQITFTAASSDPIWRGWGGVDEYVEVLNIRAADIDWVSSGNAPLLWMHDAQQPIGRLTGAKVIEGVERDTIEVTAQFYKEDEGSEKAWRQVSSGMIRNVSIGWTTPPKGYRIETVRDDKGEHDVLIFEEMSLREVSFVTTPADQSVGVGRSDIRSLSLERSKPKQEATMPNEDKTDEQKVEEQDQKRSDVDAHKPAAKAAESTPKEELAERKAEAPFNPEGQRWLADNETKIRQFGVDDEGVANLRNLVDQDKGCSAEAVRSAIWDFTQERDESDQSRATPAPTIMKRTQSTFDATRMMKNFVKGRAQDGIEAEIITEFENATSNWAPNRAANSILIPHSALLADPNCRAALLQGVTPEIRQRAGEIFGREFTVGSTPTGYHHEVFDESFFVDALIAPAKLLQKVTKLPQQLMQDLVGVVESGEITVLHGDEQGTTAESAGLTFGNRTFQWKQVRARKDFTQRTLDQSQFFFPRLMYVLRRDTIRAQNKALINGTAAANQPVGILNYSGINTVSLGVNGGTPAYGDMVDMYTNIAAANVDADGMCFAMTPEIMGRLQKTPRFTNSTGAASDKILSGGGMGMMTNIDGYEVIMENNLPKNLTKGTGTNLHAMIFGDFSDIEMGMFSGIEMTMDPYTDMAENGIRVYLRQAYDILPRHVASVTRVVDAIAT